MILKMFVINMYIKFYTKFSNDPNRKYLNKNLNIRKMYVIENYYL